MAANEKAAGFPGANQENPTAHIVTTRFPASLPINNGRTVADERS